MTMDTHKMPTYDSNNLFMGLLFLPRAWPKCQLFHFSDGRGGTVSFKDNIYVKTIFMLPSLPSRDS